MTSDKLDAAKIGARVEYQLEQLAALEKANHLGYVDLLRNAAPEMIAVVRAALEAKEHISELREAFRTGDVTCTDGLDGMRSNRNSDIDVLLFKSLAALSLALPVAADKVGE